MSKFLNFALPAVGGTALVLGLAYGIASRDYRASELAALEARVERAVVDTVAKGAGGQTAAPTPDTRYGLGRVAHKAEIAAWDVDVLPDGRGLPQGSGNAYDGEEIFAEKCASCHGDFAEGVDNWPVLAGGFDTLADEDPVKTVGSYWPHLSTAWDYIYRSMPFGAAGTLSVDETYAIVAYILYSNDLIADDFELTHENLGQFEMYNKDGFIIDDRPALEYGQWRAAPCMANCKERAEVTMRSVFLLETPPEGGSNSIMNPARAAPLPSFTAAGAAYVPKASVQPTQVSDTAAPADDGTALAKAGERVFKRCKACHEVGDGARHRTGPHLNGILGRGFAGSDGFAYSTAFKAAGAEGRVWDEVSLAAFLANPKSYIKGTKMAFGGLREEGDQAALIAYLRSFPDN